MIKIERNIPFPAPSRKEGFFPFPKMKVGDSFFAERNILQMGSSRQYWEKKLKGTKFVIRSVPNGVRVWRVS
jgi:hypothetical protein